MRSLNGNRNRGFALAFFICFSLSTAGAAAVFAEEQNGGVPGDWLSRYAGARPLGIGGAYVSCADEPLGVIWNPSCLTQIFQNETHFETALLFEGTTINSISFAVPARKFPSFGLTVIALRSGEFERTSELNEHLGTFREGDMAFLLSASKNITTRFALGANVKIVRQSIEDFDATGVGADLGLLYDVLPSLRLGASVLNVGGPNLTLRDIKESYPVEFRGGLSLRFFSGRILVAAEIDHRSGPGTSFRTGGEFWLHNVMALRFGYDNEYFTGGFSANVRPDIRIDYAMADHELGVTHRIGFSYRFGGFYASSEAAPPVFSPLGQQSVTKFHLKVKTKADARSWNLEIKDKSNHVVRRFSGKGGPPAHVMWDGKNEAGLSLPDGIYSYQLTVADLEGREIVGCKRTVEITTTGPQGEVPVVVH